MSIETHVFAFCVGVIVGVRMIKLSWDDAQTTNQRRNK